MQRGIGSVYGALNMKSYKYRKSPLVLSLAATQSPPFKLYLL